LSAHSTGVAALLQSSGRSRARAPSDRSEACTYFIIHQFYSLFAHGHSTSPSSRLFPFALGLTNTPQIKKNKTQAASRLRSKILLLLLLLPPSPSSSHVHRNPSSLSHSLAQPHVAVPAALPPKFLLAPPHDATLRSPTTSWRHGQLELRDGRERWGLAEASYTKDVTKVRAREGGGGFCLSVYGFCWCSPPLWAAP
jgi:hypothetical protein